MSTGDTEEVPPSERQLVVFDPQAYKPIYWPNNWILRYWKLDDSFPTYPALDPYPDNLRRYSNPGHWPRRVPKEYIKPQFEQLDNILRSRRTLFNHFPRSQSWDTLSHLIIATLHGEEACTPELTAPIKPITTTTSKKINFFRTENYLHRYLPVVEFTASSKKQRQLCREILEASPPREKVRKIRKKLRASGRKWNIETGWGTPSDTNRANSGTSGWGSREVPNSTGNSRNSWRSARWHTLRSSQRYPEPFLNSRTGELVD